MSNEIIVNEFKENNQKVIANAFAEHYSTIGEKLAKQLKGNNPVNENPNPLITHVDNSLSMYPTNITEVRKLIKSLRTKHSVGHDKISNNLIKEWCDAISIPLTKLFN